MDKNFKQFEKWYLKRKSEWEKIGILSEFGHQYHINVHTKNGIGNIVLYESNGYYWIDFEAGNFYTDMMFNKANIDYYNKKDILLCEKIFIECII